MTEQPRYMTDCEKRLARLWHEEDETPVEEIARRLRRNRSSIWELLGLDEGTERAGVGRKPALTEDDKTRLVTLTENLVKKAKVRYLVTVAMIQALFRPQVSIRVIADSLHDRGNRIVGESL